MKSLPKKNRHISYKIPDIRLFRHLTIILGKLKIQPLYYVVDNRGYLNYLKQKNEPIGNIKPYETHYGYALGECKAFVEQWFNYTKELSPTEVPYIAPYPHS